MAFEFKLPDLGEGVHEGEIVRWHVSEGDIVRLDQPLVEVMTDKVTTDLPSPVAGRVQSLGAQPGDVLQVGQVLVTIDTSTGKAEPQPEGGSADPAPVSGGLVPPEDAGDDDTLSEQVAERVLDTTPTPGAAAPGEAAAGVDGVPLAVPAVRRLARELGVDLRQVCGTGPGGRIVEGDVRSAATATAAPSVKPVREAGSGRPAAAGEERVRRQPLRGLRRIIADHMLDAQRNTAPYTYVEEIDFTELVGLRERVQPLAEKVGVRMTYLPFILAAVGVALREHPRVNATVDQANGDLLLHEDQHVAIAVNTAEGLVVPVVRNVQDRNLLDMAREIDRLSQAARDGRLAREEVQGGTFSVTSLGALGGVLGTPVLNTPQVAILGVHRISARPVVRSGEIISRQMANLSLTLDHRYLDGFDAASFAQTLRKYLEDPAVMLFWLAELKGGA